jgi:SRSO17 transposase
MPQPKETAMNLQDEKAIQESEVRFNAYMDEIASILRHCDRREPLRDYSRGLLTAPGRKSVEPLAATVAPEKTAAKHQSLLHFVGQSAWSDADVLNEVREKVQPLMEQREPTQASIIDDTGYPKKGKDSVGVARQYCGQLGKQDNCQNAVSLSIANHHASLPIGYRLYLPKEWATDRERRKKAGVPKEVRFKTKPKIAIDLIKQALAQNVSLGVILADAGYGVNTAFRDDLTALGLTYAVGISPTTTVWAPGTEPLPPKQWSGHGRRPTQLRRDKKHKPVNVKKLAMSFPQEAWQTVTWREGVDKELTSRFARLRIRPAHKNHTSSALRSEEWLVIEWPEDEKQPTKYWLATLPEDMPFDKMIDIIKLRWRIERDYQELKQEVGLGHYEGRGWRGFHHHATLCIVAYGFLISEQETFPPSKLATTMQLQKTPLPQSYQPRGSSSSFRTSHSQLHRNAA